MIDLAKAACTSPINLCSLDPDFACVSFYKLFGAPTGVGALFIKRSIRDLLTSTMNRTQSMKGECSKLSDGDTLVSTFNHKVANSHFRRRYFGGGSVDIVLNGIDFMSPRSSPSLLSSLTYGTLNYRGIISLLPGFDEIRLLGGMRQISNHTCSLVLEAVNMLRKLKHKNGRYAIVMYGIWGRVSREHDSDMYIQPSNLIDYFNKNNEGKQITPGPTIAFNIVRSDGSYVGYNEVSKLAALIHSPIQLRTGCFCNPGACQEALKLNDDELLHNFLQSGKTCGDDIDIINGKPTGAIRLSFGKDSLWEDLYNSVVFIKKMFCSAGERLNIINHENLFDVRDKTVTSYVSEMYIFPIKSCAAMRVKRWKMSTLTGKLLFDRGFALVDSSGIALRLSRYPRMMLIQPSIDLESMILTLSAPGQLDLIIQLENSNENTEAACQIQVCGNDCTGFTYNDVNVYEWFSSFLKVRCWLARYVKRSSSGHENNNTKTKLDSLLDNSTQSCHRTGFENEAPLLLVSQDSVDTLNALLSQLGSSQTSTKCFRPNLVVAKFSEQSFEHLSLLQNPEDACSRITLRRHGITLDITGKCARCAMVDIDPTNVMKKGRTLRALAEYRRENGQIYFGVFLSINTCSPKSHENFVDIHEGEELIFSF